MEFYVQLFSSQPLDCAEQDFFLRSLSLQLSPDQLRSCKGSLTVDECKRALDGMASGKSPGVDGFPAEFYKRFWNILGEDLVGMINYGFSAGRLSATQRSGVITLLHKKVDCLSMKNWRPITLLCVDYKIAAKSLANCLLTVLPGVIHANRTCGVP